MLELVKSQPDGFTVDSKTFQPISSGYAVAPFKNAQLIVDRNNLSIDQMILMISYIDKITRLTQKSIYAGGWFNANDNQYYLDASMVVKDLDRALYLAKSVDQYAIYDLSAGKIIETQTGIDKLKKTGQYNEFKEKEAENFVHQIQKAWTTHP